MHIYLHMYMYIDISKTVLVSSFDSAGVPHGMGLTMEGRGHHTSHITPNKSIPNMELGIEHAPEPVHDTSMRV